MVAAKLLTTASEKSNCDGLQRTVGVPTPFLAKSLLTLPNSSPTRVCVKLSVKVLASSGNRSRSLYFQLGYHNSVEYAVDFLIWRILPKNLAKQNAFGCDLRSLRTKLGSTSAPGPTQASERFCHMTKWRHKADVANGCSPRNLPQDVRLI